MCQQKQDERNLEDNLTSIGCHHQRQIQRQSGDHSQEYLANFGYKLNMKVIYKKTSFYSFGYLF
jgi:hypothetical protein